MKTTPVTDTAPLRNLVIFELANNHQGDVAHGTKIIHAMGELAKKYNVTGAMKFQFRQLDSFIHPGHKEQSDNKHISRFQTTCLTRADFEKLLSEVSAQGLLSMCTPFDEESVKIIDEMGFDIVKIGSCSAMDWPLIECIANIGKPVVASTGGLTLEQIDDLYSFFQHKGVDAALMHCVSIYPSPSETLQLNQIDFFKSRYPDFPVGWSTHENPNTIGSIQIAVAKGAELFERHVGIETDTIKLNGYSSTPAQVDAWLAALNEARAMCGVEQGRPQGLATEIEALATLQRGVYVKETIAAGEILDRDRVYFAMPIMPGQLPSGEWREGVQAKVALMVDVPLLVDDITMPQADPDHVIKKAIHEVKAMLNEAKVHLNTDFQIEYSHHKGVENFRKVGAVLINIINRSYCKKIIVQLPGQAHPQHYHKLKEETFQVLNGVLNVIIEGRKRVLLPGDTCLIQPGMWHSFWTETGCIFEEISTRHYNDDSFYKDKRVNAMVRSERKTIVNHWGRYELPDKLRDPRV